MTKTMQIALLHLAIESMRKLQTNGALPVAVRSRLADVKAVAMNALDDLERDMINAIRQNEAPPSVDESFRSEEPAFEEIYIDLMKQLQRRFANDPTSPGVLLSQLPDGRYYAALHRFRKRYGKDRMVFMKAFGSTPRKVIRDLRRQFAQWEKHSRKVGPKHNDFFEYGGMSAVDLQKQVHLDDALGDSVSDLREQVCFDTDLPSRRRRR